jgi:Lrp/AsnC family leucine-responsive transcriptional regulator
MTNKQITLDETDIRLLNTLWNSGRATLADMGKECGLSAPGVADRLRRLERNGVILGYAPRIDLAAAGFGLTAFVEVTLGHPSFREAFLDLVASLPEIRECHHVTGSSDYLLKAVCSGTAHLEELISERLKGCPGVAATRTSVVLSTPKDRPGSPLPDRP